MLNSLQDFTIENKITIPTNHHLVVLCYDIASQFAAFDWSWQLELQPNSSLQLVEFNSTSNFENVKVEQLSNSNFFWFKLVQSNLNSNLDLNIKGNVTTTKVFNLIIPTVDSTVNLNQAITTSNSDNLVEHFSRSVQELPSTVNLQHKLVANWSTINLQANQKLQILSLNTRAKQSMQPILEIASPLISCVHGATLSHMEEFSQMYLRSRGLSKFATQKILVSAFVRVLVHQIPVLCLQEEVIKELKFLF